MLDCGDVAELSWPDTTELTNMKVTITPDKGYWRRASFEFSIKVGADYPHAPPKVSCRTPIYHPNIDKDGNVCLNILKADWKPVLDVTAVIHGLIFLFDEPNPDDPLNHGASQHMPCVVCMCAANIRSSFALGCCQRQRRRKCCVPTNRSSAGTSRTVSVVATLTAVGSLGCASITQCLYCGAWCWWGVQRQCTVLLIPATIFLLVASPPETPQLAGCALHLRRCSNLRGCGRCSY